MKIIKFKKTAKGKYKLYLDNGDSLTLYEDVIVNNNLIFNKEVSEKQIDLLIEQNNDVHAYEIALNYISVRLRSESEIKDYLKKKQVSEKMVDQVIERLRHENYVNDFNFAKAYCNDQMVLTPSGPDKIKSYLMKFGINGEVAQEVVQEIDESIISEKLSNLMEKQIKLKKGSSSLIKIKLINYFVNLGYSKEMILEELSKFSLKTDTSHLQKEYNKLYNKYKKKYDGESLKRFIISKLYAKGYSSSDISKIKDEN